MNAAPQFDSEEPTQPIPFKTLDDVAAAWRAQQQARGEDERAES